MASEQYTFENSYNSSKVVANSGDVGGIIGWTNVNVLLNNCSNSGIIESVGAMNGIGGLVGYASKELTMKKCQNSGEIKGTGSYGIAGLVGICLGELMTIDECYNSGTITGDFGLGGLVGEDNGRLVATNSYNTGNIVGAMGTSGISLSGGIAGYVYQGGTYVRNCYNTGDIKTEGNIVGGLIGQAPAGTFVDNAFNQGKISSTYEGSVGCLGGIIGQVQYTKISNCYNIGDISTKSAYGGGLIGECTTNGSSYTACYNSGNVSADDGFAGGIVGHSYVATFDKCNNTGDIKVSSEGSYATYTGEIVGTDSNVNITVENCTFLQKITNANDNGAIPKSQTEMDGIMSIQSLVNLMNSYVIENNADSTKTKLKTWKVENGLPVFED